MSKKYMFFRPFIRNPSWKWEAIWGQMWFQRSTRAACKLSDIEFKLTHIRFMYTALYNHIIYLLSYMCPCYCIWTFRPVLPPKFWTSLIISTSDPKNMQLTNYLSNISYSNYLYIDSSCTISILLYLYLLALLSVLLCCTVGGACDLCSKDNKSLES